MPTLYAHCESETSGIQLTTPSSFSIAWRFGHLAGHLRLLDPAGGTRLSVTLHRETVPEGKPLPEAYARNNRLVGKIRTLGS